VASEPDETKGDVKGATVVVDANNKADVHARQSLNVPRHSSVKTGHE
jgi:hypothetical protein